jgi:broad-specificity NMP kinase
MKIILEGTDLIGKSTQVNKLRELGYDVQDREKNICSNIVFDIAEDTAISNIQKELNSNKYFLIVMYITAKQILDERLKYRKEHNPESCSDYDNHAWEYNNLYIKIFSKIKADNLYLLNVDNKDIETINNEIISIIKKKGEKNYAKIYGK